MSRCFRVGLFLALIVALLTIAGAACAATDTAASIDWTKLIEAVWPVLLPFIAGLLMQSPWIRAMGAKIQKLLPGATVDDGIKFEQILTNDKARRSLLEWIRNYTLVLLVGILMCGFLAPAAQCHTSTVQPLALAPVQMSMAVTPPEQAVAARAFSLTYFHDGTKDALGVPIARWKFGKLSLAAIPIVRVVEGQKSEIGVVEAFGYEVDCKALLQKIGVKNVTLVLTPRYGPRQVNGDKPEWVWGGTVELKWAY